MPVSGGGSKPGERRGGRQKGTPNKLSGDIKAMILAALDKAGGAEYLYRQALDNPNAFLSLVGRVLPMQLNATFKGDGRDLSEAELIAIASGAGIAEQAAGEAEPGTVH
jgi:hypothetical protein